MKSSRFIAIGAVAFMSVAAIAQQNYTPGTLLFKRTGHNQWGKPGEFGLLDWSTQTDRGDIDIPFGAFINPLDVGRTGAGLILNLGGALGIRIQVWGKNGVINVEYPAAVTLTYPDPNTLRPGDPFSISSSFERIGDGSITTTAPEFGFSLAGLIDLTASLKAGVWLFGENIIEETIFSEALDDVEIGLFNTDLPGFKEYVNANAGHYELFGGIVEGDYGFPSVTTAGGNGPGNSLASTGLDEFLTATVSITDAILMALGSPIDLNGEGGFPDRSWGEFTWEFHLLDLRLDGGFSLVQDFTFEPAPIVELNFSNGEKHLFHAGDTINLTMPAVAPGATSNNLVISPTFSMEGSANNHSKLRFNIALVFEPFSMQAHIEVGGDVPLVGFVGIDETVNLSLGTINLFGYEFDVDLVDKDFDIKGFNAVRTTPFTVEGFKYPGSIIGQLSPVCVPLNALPFDLTVQGSNFVQSYTNGAGTVPGSIVRLDGAERATTYVSSGVLTGAILASDTAVEGRKQITAFNPPPGGGNSNPLELIVDGSPPTIAGAANPASLNKTANPKVLISVTISGTITDLLSGVDTTTGTYAVSDEYGQIQPSGTVTVFPNGSYSFVVRLAPTRLAKDSDGRKYVVTIKAKDKLGFEGTKVVNVIVTQ